MKIIIDKMRIIIDLHGNDKDKADQIFNGILELNRNDLLFRRITCENKNKIENLF